MTNYDDKALAQFKDLVQLKSWLVDQMELDHELLIEGKINHGFKSFGDRNTLIPYYQFMNNRNDMMSTLHVATVNSMSDNGVDAKVYDLSDKELKKPFTHLMMINRIDKVISA